jgi:hypothetical protein
MVTTLEEKKVRPSNTTDGPGRSFLPKLGSIDGPAKVILLSKASVNGTIRTNSWQGTKPGEPSKGRIPPLRTTMDDPFARTSRDGAQWTTWPGLARPCPARPPFQGWHAHVPGHRDGAKSLGGRQDRPLSVPDHRSHRHIMNRFREAACHQEGTQRRPAGQDGSRGE